MLAFRLPVLCGWLAPWLLDPWLVGFHYILHIFMFVLQLHEYHCGKSIIKIALSLLQYDVENIVFPPITAAAFVFLLSVSGTSNKLSRTCVQVFQTRGSCLQASGFLRIRVGCGKVKPRGSSLKFCFHQFFIQDFISCPCGCLQALFGLFCWLRWKGESKKSYVSR